MEPTGPDSSWPWGSGAILLVCGQRHHRCNPFESLLLLTSSSVPGESANRAFRLALLALLLLRLLSAAFGGGLRSAVAKLSKRKKTVKQKKKKTRKWAWKALFYMHVPNSGVFTKLTSPRDLLTIMNRRVTLRLEQRGESSQVRLLQRKLSRPSFTSQRKSRRRLSLLIVGPNTNTAECAARALCELRCSNLRCNAETPTTSARRQHSTRARPKALRSDRFLAMLVLLHRMQARSYHINRALLRLEVKFATLWESESHFTHM